MKSISLNPHKIIRSLGAITLFLILASLAGLVSKFLFGHGNLKDLIPLFNLDTENNIPTFFSTLLLIFACFLLALIAVMKRQEKAPHAVKWAILSFGFLLIAYDQVYHVHETLILPIRSLLGDDRHDCLYPGAADGSGRQPDRNPAGPGSFLK